MPPARERAVLFGYSEGGPMAMLFAATHPERVSSLVLYGAYAKRTRSDDYPWAQSEEDRVRYTEHLVNDLGLGRQTSGCAARPPTRR